MTKPSPPPSLSLYQKIIKVSSDGLVHLHTHSGQSRALNSIARFVFMISGVQGGKTILGPLWLYEEIRRLGPGDYMAATSNYGLFKLKMLPAMIEYFVNILHVGKFWPGLGVIEIAHPSKGFTAKTQHDPMYARIVLRTASAPAGLESATVKAAWLDECGQASFKYEAWEAIQRRLSIHQGRVLGTTTPYNLGWLKTQVHDRWERGDKDYEVIRFSSTANPAFPQAEYDRAKATLPDWRFKMFYDANFAKPFGLIYMEYTEPEMLSDEDDFPAHWPRLVGLDFGGANTATLYLAENIDVHPSVFHVCKEFIEGGMSTKDHVAKAFLRLVDAKVHRFVGGAPSETQPRMDWAKAGIKVEQPPFEDVEVGISNVIELFKMGRLKVHPSMGGLRDELGTYQRKVDAEGSISNDILDKNTFHRLDALRYACSVITHVNTKVVGAWGRKR